MDKPEIDKEFERLWAKNYYVLVKSNTAFGYTIHDVEMGLFVIIELDKIVPYIINKMLENGAKVYESMKDLPLPQHPTKWTCMEEWISFAQVSKELHLNEEQKVEVGRRVVGRKLSKDQIKEVIKSFNY